MAKTSIIRVGEINTASNVGSGVGVFRLKDGTNLEFRSLVPGSHAVTIELNDDGDEVIIDASHIFEATCLSTDQVGHCVYIRAGVNGGGNYRVGKSNIELDLKVPAIGIIIDKITATDCFVQCSGELSGFGSLDPGKMIFVGRDALIQQAPIPEPDPGGQVFIQRMGTALSADTILLDPNFQLVKRVGT